MNLTTKQFLVLDYIKRFIAERNYSPTIREIMIGLGLTSPSTIHEHLKTLVNKGMITYEPSKSRTIELLVPNEYLNEDKIIKIKLINEEAYISVAENMLNGYDSKCIFAYRNDKSIYFINIKLVGIKGKKSLYKDNDRYIISQDETLKEIGTIISEFKTY